MFRTLAIDVGEKRVGFATSDELGITVSPAGYTDRAAALDRVVDLVRLENIGTIVVGLPYLPSGGLGSQASDIYDFVGKLQEVITQPIEYENEVHTSQEAEARLGLQKRKKIEKGDVDEMAAMIILESYLNRR